MTMQRVRQCGYVLLFLGLVGSTAPAQPPAHDNKDLPESLESETLPGPRLHEENTFGAPQVEQHSGVVDLTPQSLPPVYDKHAGENAHEKEHPGALLAEVDYLFVRPRRTDSAYALVDPSNDITPNGTVATVQAKMRSGVRAAVGYRIPNSDWEARARYTYFQSNGTSTASAPTTGLLYALLTRPGIVDEATAARANNGLWLHSFGGELSKPFDFETVQVHLGTGLRFLSLDQELDAFYNGRDATNTAVHSRAEFEGVGPEVFADCEWKLGWGLGLFSGARAALLYGTSRTSLRETNFRGAVVNANFQHNFSHAVPSLEFALGVSWHVSNLEFRAGYTINQWLNLGGTPRLSDDFSEGRFIPSPSNLSLEGFFLRGGLVY